MRILQITPYLDPKLGGQERHVLALSGTLSGFGHDVTILTCGSYPSNIVKSFSVLTVHSAQIIGLRIVPIREIVHFVSEKRFDICHLHHQTVFGETVLLVNKVCGLPTVTTLHSLMMRRIAAKLLYDRISLRIIGALSSKVICLSPNIMQNLVRRGLKRSKCIVIPNALDVRALENQFRKMGKELPEPKFDLLFVGRLERRKGVHWLLKSLILLHKKGKKYTLRIVGHGPLTRELSNIISANNLSQHVKLMGYVPQQELLELYLLAKVVVIPSLYEGIPTVALEAMAAGKPLIVSNIPGLNELLINGGNGLMVNPMDTRGLAFAINNLLASPNYLSSVSNVNKKVLAQFDWRAVANNILNIYREVLSDNYA